MNANEALSKLKEGNNRFSNEANSSNTTKELRKSLVAGQKPYAIILSCADSRVLPESAFDAAAGELFVCRVAGNVANTSTIASIEYAVAHLGTKLIVVLGHQSCGAVAAAIGGGDNGYNLNHLLSHIAPALAKTQSKDVNSNVKVNAELNAGELANRSTIIANAVSNEGLVIKSAYYNLDSGIVDFI